jgi:alkylation response protein AidB-like acyl-CoA dehydrogenase
MDLDFTEEQELLRETVRGLCERHVPVSVVRAMEDDATGFPEPFWKQLGELGLTGLLLPEQYGGGGQTALEGAVLYEEIGRALAPSPHFASAVMSGGVLLRAGSDAQKDEWLPRIASGAAVVVPAWLEPDGAYRPRGVQCRAERDGDGFRLTGKKRHVPFAKSATRFLVLARTGTAENDVDLFLVDPAASGVSSTQRFSVASDTQYDLTLDGVRVRAADRVGAAGGGWAAWNAALYDGAILLAAQAIGGAERALEITVQYSKEREQFEKPLGAFQALSHNMADASTAVDGGKTLAYQAAWARASGRSVARLAPMAKLFCCDTFRDVTAMALQIHGGMGFTVDYDVQLYFRRAKQLQLSWWDARHLEELIAADVLDGDEAPPFRVVYA